MEEVQPNVQLKHRCSVFLSSIFWQTYLVSICGTIFVFGISLAWQGLKSIEGPTMDTKPICDSGFNGDKYLHMSGRRRGFFGSYFQRTESISLVYVSVCWRQAFNIPVDCLVNSWWPGNNQQGVQYVSIPRFLILLFPLSRSTEISDTQV